MAQKIVWTSRALKDYEAVAAYILSYFGENAFSKFSSLLTHKISSIQSNPQLYPASSKRKGIRKAVVSKRLIIFYRYKIGRQEIEIISLWDTRKNINQ